MRTLYLALSRLLPDGQTLPPGGGDTGGQPQSGHAASEWGVYTQRFNRCHGRVGHVFQGRYKGLLVERDSYLLELARYVVLNPVQAGMVSEAQEWPWSGYRAMVGQAPRPEWLEVGWLLGQFGSRRGAAM